MGKTVCVVLPAYDEEENIKQAILDFYETGKVDKVLVVDNNSKDRTAELIKETNALYFLETNQGYGWALYRGLVEAEKLGYDLIITCEPDGTFTASDVNKLLAYADYDSVFGTRTCKQMILPGANMGPFLYYGNKFVASLLWLKAVVLWSYGGPIFTDVGCTFKLVSRELLGKIKPDLMVRDSSFSPDFMLACLKHSSSVIEIPLWYGSRLGKSKITGSFKKAFKLGLRMIWLIMRKH